MKEQQFSTAFTTLSKAVTKTTNPLLLGRFQVMNQNGNEFERQLRLWTKGA